jgi:hypothetical protein
MIITIPMSDLGEVPDRREWRRGREHELKVPARVGARVKKALVHDGELRGR